MFIQPYVFAKNHKLFTKKINFIMYKLYLSKKREENHPPKVGLFLTTLHDSTNRFLFLT